MFSFPPAYRSAFTSLFTLAWPVVVARFGIMLMGLMDTVFVGHYSSVELGYHSLAWAPTSVFLLTSIGLLVGLQVKTSHYLGAGEPDRIGAVFRRGLAYALGLGLGSMLLLILFVPLLFRASVGGTLAEGATGPMMIFAASMPFYMIYIGCAQFLEALGRTRQNMYFMILANVVNLALLLWLVPGEGTPFGLHGAMAAAVATFVARLAMLLAAVAYVLSLPQVRAFGLFRKHPADKAAAVDQRRIGYAAGASYFIEVGAFAAMTFFAGRLGEIAVAQWAIVLNFASLVFMAPVGLAVGCSVLVGRAFGARDARAVSVMGRVSFAAAAAVMVLISASVLIGAQTLARFYTDDPALILGVQAALLLSCLFFLPDGLQVVAAQALRARKDVVMPTVIHYVSYGLIMMPLAWLFAIILKQGVPGLIYAVIVASLISSAFLVGRFFWLDKRPIKEMV